MTKRIQHGLSGGAKNPTRLYKLWKTMRGRCNNPNKSDYARYGGRGIVVCSEWDNFEVFYKWAHANGYQDGLTIERKNNDKNYEPSNCRWATRKEQARNRNCNHFVTYNAETKTIAEWAECMGIPSNVLRMRFHRRWSIERSLTVPVGQAIKLKKLKEAAGL